MNTNGSLRRCLLTPLVVALVIGATCGDELSGNADPSENRVAVLTADSQKGDHYFAPVRINGQTEMGMIDTGASTVAMSAALATKFGIDTISGKSSVSSTANGTITTTYLVVPLINIAGIEVRDVPVSIGISNGLLIGMSFLRRVNVSMQAGTLTMSSRR